MSFIQIFFNQSLAFCVADAMQKKNRQFLAGLVHRVFIRRKDLLVKRHKRGFNPVACDQICMQSNAVNFFFQAPVQIIYDNFIEILVFELF